MAGYGKIFPLEKYFEMKIKPLNWKFRRRKSQKIVCPFHADERPSMGFIQNKDGSEIFHCFGCGAKGDVVKMHQMIEKEYHNRSITREQSLRELSEMFGYPYEKLELDRKKEETKKIENVHSFYTKPEKPMTVQKFEKEFSKAKKDRRDIRFFNSLLIQMIMSNKEGGDT